MKRKMWQKFLAVSLSAAMAVPGAAAAADVQDTAEAKKTVTAAETVADPDGGFQTLQEALEQNKKSIQSRLPHGEVTFILEMEEDSLLEQKPEASNLDSFLETAKGKAAASLIDSQQLKAKSALAKSDIKAEIGYTYKSVLNGFSVKADYSAKADLEALPGVKKVYLAQTHDYIEPINGYTPAAATHTSGGMMGSDSANAEGYDGRGTVTAVLDTGCKVDHEAFANAPEEQRFSEADISEKITAGDMVSVSAGNVSAKDVYQSEKIPYAYDYADNDADVADSQGHGTHVAGTVGGDCENFTGVAPETQLVIMKVFSDTSDGASDDWIFAALEDCVTLGVDGANMSLGSPSGFTTEEGLCEEVYGRVQAAGINLMCAAGNEYSSAYYNNYGTDLAMIENPDSAIVGSPSTYKAALSVASVNENEVFSTYFMVGEATVKYNDSVEAEELRWTTLEGTQEYVPVPGLGEVTDYEGLDVQGKIALVQRGTITFTEKEQNAANAGAKAIIIYDNVDGDLLNMQTGGLIPMIAISRADGEMMAAREDKTITISKDFAQNMPSAVGGEMSDFSSLGVAPDLSLKPEITAPGGNVYSSTVDGGYGNMSGTSMATPHMAGAGAVMRQYVNEAFPELTSVQKQTLVNELLMSTAEPVIDSYGVAYTPRKQGAGLAQVSDAIRTNGYITVGESGRTKAELGDSEEGVYDFTFTVHNMGTEDLTYDIGFIPLVAEAAAAEDGSLWILESSRELGADEFMASFSGDAVAENKVTVPAGATTDVAVHMELTDGGKNNLMDFVNGIFMDGFIRLYPVDSDEPDLTLPYLGFYGNWANVPIFDSDEYDDELAFMFESGIFKAVGNDLYYLGLNGFTEEFDRNKIVIPSKSLKYGRDAIYPMTGLLRAPKEAVYTVTNADGEVVYQDTQQNVMKSFYYANGGFITYDLGPDGGWFPLYFKEDQAYYLPDGDYTYTITARADGASMAEAQSISYPVILDNVEPAVIGYEMSVEDGVPLLTIDMLDDNYIMGCQLEDSDKNPLTNVMVFNQTAAQRGGIGRCEIDMTGALEAGITGGYIAIIDYANHMVEVPLSFLYERNLVMVAISMAEMLKEEDYTEETYEALLAAIQAADEACLNAKVTKEELLEQIMALQLAVNALVPRAQVELEALQADYEALQTQLNKTAAELEAAQAEINALNAAISEKDQTISNLSAAIITEQAKAAEWQQKYDAEAEKAADIQTQLDAKESELAAAQNTLAEKEAAISELNGQIKSLNSEIDGLKAELASAGAQKQELEAQLAAKSEALAAAQAELDKIKGEGGTIAQLNAQIADLNGKITKLNGDVTAANERVVEFQDKLNEANASVSSLQGELATVRGEKSALQGQLTTANAQITALNTEKGTLTAQIADLNKQIGALTTEKDNVKSQLDIANGQISNLEDRLKEEQDKAENLENQLKDEKDKTTSLEDQLKDEKDKTTSLEDQLKDEQDKTTSLEDQLKGEQDKTTSLEDQLKGEQDKTTSLQEQLKSEQGKTEEQGKEKDDLAKQLAAAKEALRKLQEENAALKVGDTAVLSNVKYRVTDAAKKLAEAYEAVNENAKSVKIAQTVTINGVSCTVTGVANKAFAGMEKLKKVVIGKNVTTIGKNAFYGDSRLKKITVSGTALKKVGKNALKGINKKAVITVPKAKKKAYTKLFKNKGQKKTVKVK